MLWAKADGILVQAIHAVELWATSQRGLFTLAVFAGAFALWLMRPRF